MRERKDHSQSHSLFRGSNGERPGSGSLPYYVTHLVCVREELRGQTRGIDKRLCQEVASLTQKRARLLFHDHHFPRNTPRSFRPSAIMFPVEYDNRNFGVLACQQKPVEVGWPQLSLADFVKLARTCGWVLWELEHTALIEGAGPQEKALEMVALSKRQREILELLGRGYDDEAIAQRLGIEVVTVRRHKQHMYKNLGVCCESDAILAAYRLHLYSPLEGISPQPGRHLL